MVRERVRLRPLHAPAADAGAGEGPTPDTPPAMAQALFAHLVNAPRKRLVIIGQGTHIVFTEQNCVQLFREVQLFLDEP